VYIAKHECFFLVPCENSYSSKRNYAFIIVVKRENINAFDETKMSFLFILTFGRAAQVLALGFCPSSYDLAIATVAVKLPSTIKKLLHGIPS